MNKIDDGWYQIAESKCPQDYGYNGIKLKVPAAGTNVVLNFKGLAGSDGNSPTSTDRAGWRYGFLTYLKNGSRVYGNILKNSQDTATFQIPENTGYLWLIVMGAPKEHFPARMGRGRNGSVGGQAEWPYQIKSTGTSPDDSVVQ